MARYGYDPREKITDFAVVVRDDWQHLGIGKYLLTKILSIGKEQGISRFVSILDPDNHTMKQIVRNLGYPVKYSYKGGATQVDVFVQREEK